MSEVRGGRAVVDLLKAEGVRYVFGIVGSTFLDVLDALYDDHSVEYVNVRHEQAGAFMADGLARVTGLPGVCLVTRDRKSTRLNSSHSQISYAVFCLKKKKKKN